MLHAWINETGSALTVRVHNTQHESTYYLTERPGAARRAYYMASEDARALAAGVVPAWKRRRQSV